MLDDPFIRFEQIRKTFVGVTALDDVSLSLARGECHCLMGENGAGKSTLGKVLAGIHKPDGGRIVIDGDLCVGNGRCYTLAPALIADDERGYGEVIGRGVVEGAMTEVAERAVRACPEGAITLVDESP